MTAGRSRRIAFITGATGGLGPVVVTVFERAGWEVARERRGDPKSSLRWFDATHADSVRRAVSGVVSSYGRIDALLNLIGTWIPQPPLEEVTERLWDEFFVTNLRTAFLMSRAVIPQMRSQGWGRIVNVGAKAAEKGTARNAAYAASKAAVLALTESIADELRGTGITANAVVPSIIDTPANRSSMPAADFSKWVPQEHIAAAILYLCGDEAASITGERIRVFGRS
jgi:NAD(P)-dependent dehydrogenase (short-subunit alcohol dehydrogenase family)